MSLTCPSGFSELVKTQVESDQLDYKSAMSWRTMSRQEKARIVRHLTAFANTRGGHLVIGVSEDASGIPSVYTGVSGEQAASFDPTPVGDFINAHIEPPLDYTIERPEVDGKRYVIFTVRPFKALPHVCSRGVEGELQEGIFYIRTAEASSRPARRAHELQELLRRCMRNEREQLGRILRGILYESRQNVEDQTDIFNDLALDAERYFRKRRHSEKGVMLKFFITADVTPELPADPDEWRDILSQCLFPAAAPEFLAPGDISPAQNTPGSLRFLAGERPLMWQFFDRGLFCFFQYTDSRELSSEKLSRFCAEGVYFAGQFAEKFNMHEEILSLRMVISPAAEAVIDGKFRSTEKEISAEIRRSAADLNSGLENHAARLLRRIGEEFRLPDRRLDQLKTAIRIFLERR